LLNFLVFMSAEDEKSDVKARLRTILDREDWVYLLSLLVPLFVYNVGLKVARIVTQLDLPGPLGFADELRSEVLFNSGYVALWIGIFAIFRRGVPRKLVLVLFHLSAILVALLTASAHSFYKTTGSTLDYNFIVLSLSSFEETRAIIASETSVLQIFLLLVVFLYVLLGPMLVTRIFGLGWHLPLRTEGRYWTVPLAVCSAALVLGGLSLLPSATGASVSFSRDAIANMIALELFTPDMEMPGPEIDTRLAAIDPPVNTSLVETPKAEKRNVVMVFMESTRAQSTTPYHESLKTTPFLNELSEESLTAERAYAVVPHTSKALVAMECGVAPPLDIMNAEAEPDVIPAQCLADLLREKGYNTAFFQSATEEWERRRMLVENFGYEDFFPVDSMDTAGFEPANYFGYEDDIMLEPSRKWLQANSDEPFLATYLTVTPHHDYTVPDRYGKKEFVKDEELNNYLNTLRYQDFFLKNLFDQYKKMGLYEDTIFVILGDHGEGFGEHGFRQHDNTIYNEGIRIPLIVHDPHRFENGRQIETPVNQFDVLPTVTDLLGYGITGGIYPGSSMLSLPEDRHLMLSCYQENRCLANINGDEKYIYYYGNRQEEFFDLSKDPHEKENIADQQPQKKLMDLRYKLLAWQTKVEATYEQRLYGGGQPDK
jgi:lipoteichoic acid synthase